MLRFLIAWALFVVVLVIGNHFGIRPTFAEMLLVVGACVVSDIAREL